MWLGFTFCWGVCMAKADTALNSTAGSSALPAANEAEQPSHQPVPTNVRVSHPGNPLTHGPEFISVSLHLNVCIICATT